jgi:hypothetical protein
MPGLCRSDALAVIIAQLEGAEYSVDVCDEPATHRVVVRRTGDGVSIDVSAEVCPSHEHEASATAGYVKTVKLRQPSIP